MRKFFAVHIAMRIGLRSTSSVGGDATMNGMPVMRGHI
jgi:hypothetical protein